MRLSRITKAITQPSRIPLALKVEGAGLISRTMFGLPDVLLPPAGNVGDQLLLTALAREMRIRNPSVKIWKTSQFPSIFERNLDFTRVFSNQWEVIHSSSSYASHRMELRSVDFVDADSEVPPKRHLIAELCFRMGLSGCIALRPYLYLTDAERASGRLAPRQIAIHCVGPDSKDGLMRNKLWPTKKMQKVVDGLKRLTIEGLPVTLLQVGVPGDPMLAGVQDLRGKTSLRQTAAILSQSEMLVDTVNGLMHLARAVECRSVIVYGGREHAWQSGYICNENLESYIDCAPCWRYNGCGYSHECMNVIEPGQILDAVQRVLSKRGEPLELQTVIL